MRKFSKPRLGLARAALMAAGMSLSTLFPSGSFAASVTLAWDASPSPGIVSYTVYYGTGDGNYLGRIPVGNTARATIPGLVEGRGYFFAVTASDKNGFESRPSNEVLYTVPVPGLTIAGVAGRTPAFLLNGHAPAPGSAWVLESSPDLHAWSPVTQGTEANMQIALVLTVPGGPKLRLRNLASGSFSTRKARVKGFADSTVFTQGSKPFPWALETSPDSKIWARVATGTNLPLNVTLVSGTNRAMFFRLRNDPTASRHPAH